MRIISKFHDFYDGVQRMAFDDSIKYIRTPIEEIFRESNNPNTLKLNKARPPYSNRFELRDTEDLAIGFCGTLYPLIRWEGKCHYSHETLEEPLKKFKDYNRLIKRFKTYFTPIACIEPFINQGSPIIALNERVGPIDWRRKAIWNARLNAYDFQKVIDPYQAFQQIEMFLSNLAMPQMPMPIMTDIQKRDSHGFDNWSFKKGKS